MGNLFAKLAPNSQLSQFFPPEATFDPERDVPDQTGKIIIVTGGNGGIGYHITKQLLRKNAKVYMAVRSPTRYKEAVTRLKEDTGGKEPILLQLDLADLCSVRNAAEEFLSKEKRLDILFNNAGVMVPPSDLLTTQGYDLQFGTNVLGHYFFTILLLPALELSTIQHGVKARIINISSALHEISPGSTGIKYETLKGGAQRDAAVRKLKPMARWKLYGASKLAIVLASNIFSEHHGGVVLSCALNPGVLRTDMQQHMPKWQRWFVFRMIQEAPHGALAPLWAGTMVEAEGLNGKYILPWGRLGKADPRAANKETQKKLKIWLDEQIKDF